MSQKAAISDGDFKRYLEVLLVIKDDEKVMELMSKAEKATRNSGPNRRDSGRRCYGCGGYGHFQATCPFSYKSLNLSLEELKNVTTILYSNTRTDIQDSRIPRNKSPFKPTS